MTTVAYAALDIIPSLRNVRSEIERQAAAPMTQAGRAAGNKFGDAAGREAGDSFRGRFSGALRGLAGIGLGVGAVSLFKSVISDASEAEQAIGGVQAVFGQYAAQVESQSNQAATALGLSATAYQQLVTVSGALLKNKGLTDFADQAQILVQTGADLAAQFGGPTSQAVEALNAALRGESDPIERYAISLNETAVNAKLAQSGQEGLTGAALDQAKVTARLALIQEQSADAAGAFSREQGTLAGQTARLQAEAENLRAELGQELLPATAGFVSVMREALPVVGGVASAVGGIASVMGKIPGPVYAAAGALAAFKLAAKFGAGDLVSGGLTKLSSGMDTLRTRTLLAKDAFKAARGGTLNLQGSYGTLTPAVGRLAASQRALATASAGAGAAMKRGLGSAIGLLGGPWGIALAAGAFALTKFYQNQKEAEARVQALTDSLDQQTGALTEQSRAAIFKALTDQGAIEAANDLGISLGQVRLAAEGNQAALSGLDSELQAVINSGRQYNADVGQFDNSAAADSAQQLRDALFGQNEEVTKAVDGFRDQAAFMGAADDATTDLTESTKKYKTELEQARTAVRKLRDAEEERRLDNVQDRRDQLALVTTLQAAQREARQGKQTLDEQKRAGQENLTALLDLADQWNQSSDKVRNARGAYEEIRQKFIEVADQMNGPNGTRKDAIKLADSLLTLPKDVPIRFRSEGFQERMAELRALREAARQLDIQIDYQNTVKAAGTGENPGAQKPPSQRTSPGVNINIDKVYANDSGDLMQKVRRRGGGGV